MRRLLAALAMIAIAPALAQTITADVYQISWPGFQGQAVLQWLETVPAGVQSSVTVDASQGGVQVGTPVDPSGQPTGTWHMRIVLMPSAVGSQTITATVQFNPTLHPLILTPLPPGTLLVARVRHRSILNPGG